MAMIKFETSVNHEGFEYYNYIVGQLFERIEESPVFMRNLDITPNQFKKAKACKNKIKNAVIEAIKQSHEGDKNTFLTNQKNIDGTTSN